MRNDKEKMPEVFFIWARRSLAVPCYVAICCIVVGGLSASLAACAGTPDSGVILKPGNVTPILGVGDTLEVRIYGEEELSGTHQVTADGNIRLPLVGPMRVRGFTSGQIAERVSAAYNQTYLKDAQVTVLVTDFVSRLITVSGQVKNPGTVPYRKDMSVIDAVAVSGGITPQASANQTLLIRKTDDGQVRIRVPLRDISEGRAPDIRVAPGDKIWVPLSAL